ncbi:MAG: ribosome-associated translation inhibitor RaiA [Thermoanaerobaculia bacterium]|nr:MAG: ribosome-associated translation inhibitor RaiA [Thermoanaerobaculia bacterium]MBZ0101550.1 ribosome-associated translation inhibitor RaiA [Thermoanaerobaculia bacterium]
MNIEFVGRHVEIDNAIRSLVAARLDRVLRFLMEPVEIRVALEEEKFRQIAEIHVSHRHGSLHAREENSQLSEAIGLAAEHLERQARRLRKRAVDRRRRAGRETANGRRWPVEVITAGSVAAGAVREVVRTSHLDVEPMTLDEAARRLEGSRNDFVVFVDTESARVNVLYRRRDEHFGLISPEG